MIIIDETTIKANDGMKLTNGTAFGSIVYIGKNDSINNWYEITDKEAAEMQECNNAFIEYGTNEGW